MAVRQGATPGKSNTNGWKQDDGAQLDETRNTGDYAPHTRPFPEPEAGASDGLPLRSRRAFTRSKEIQNYATFLSLEASPTPGGCSVS